MHKFRKYFVLGGVTLGLLTQSLYADEDKLSVSGFIDMSYYYESPDKGDSTSSSAVDQLELNLGYQASDGLSFSVDIESQNDEFTLEQAVLTYKFNDSVSVKAGRFLSYSGWETEEPTGLFQYSGTGYAPYFYGYYQEGVSIYAAGDMFDVGLSVVNDIFALGNDTSEPAVELAMAFHPSDSFTMKAFFMTESLPNSDKSIDMINVWASYVVGNWTLAAEINSAENTANYPYAPIELEGVSITNPNVGDEANGYLLMVNYAWDKYGVTFRHHDYDVESGAGLTTVDASAFTIAGSYAVTKNLLLVSEFRWDKDEATSNDFNSFALEALVTF